MYIGFFFFFNLYFLESKIEFDLAVTDFGCWA